MKRNPQLRACPVTSAVLVAALAGPPTFAFVAQLSSPAAGLTYQCTLQALYCGLAVFVLWSVVSLERRPLSTIGLRWPTWSVLGWSALLVLVIVYGLPMLSRPALSFFDSRPVQAGIEGLSRLPLWYRLLIGATGGAVEELLYRGYAVERLQELSGRTWVAVAVSIAVFSAAHIPAWGIGFALTADLPFAVLMTLFYVWHRNLVANVIVHSSGLLVAMVTVAS